MNNLFTEDSVFMNMLFRITDIVALNILFIVTCLPVFTIGAALTALNYTAMTAIKYEDGYIAKKYFKAFISNFKQSTVSWLLMLLVGAVLFFDVYFWVIYWTTKHAAWSQIMIVVSVVMAFVFSMTFVWLFPIISKFKNTTGKMIWNALALAVKHFPWTILLLVTAVLVPLFTYWSFYFLMFMVICGFGALAYAYAFMFQHIFKQYTKNEEETPEEREENADEAASGKGTDHVDEAVPDKKENNADEAPSDKAADIEDDAALDKAADNKDKAASDKEKDNGDEDPTEQETENKDSAVKTSAGTVKHKGRMIQYVNSYEDEE